MSIKTLYVAAAAGAVLIAGSVGGTVVLLSHIQVPAIVCTPPMPGGDGTRDCVRVNTTRTEPAKTTTPGPTNLVGLTCPDGQHWVDLDNGSYCSPNA